MSKQIGSEHRGTHTIVIAYLAWIFGFMGIHRFYFGRPISGIIWFFTLGLLFIGWIVDAFLIPSMNRSAAQRFTPGVKDYDVSWLLLLFLGLLGAHRFYLGKWITGIIWLCTGGLFLLGIIYDLCTLNGQVDRLNRAANASLN